MVCAWINANDVDDVDDVETREVLKNFQQVVFTEDVRTDVTRVGRPIRGGFLAENLSNSQAVRWPRGNHGPSTTWAGVGGGGVFPA